MAPLKKCNICGREANTSDELHHFRWDKHCKYNRINLCHSCYRKKHPIKPETRRKACKKYYATHKPLFKKYNEKRNLTSFDYLGQRVTTTKILRINSCSKCGKSYPEDLKKQTHLHHIEYDEQNKIAHTVELCTGCHLTLHRLLKKVSV